MPLTANTVGQPSLALPAPRFPALLGRLMLAGVIGGVLAGIWELVVTERALNPALAIEEARRAETQGHPEETLSRTTQLVGGFLGTLVAAVVFSIVVAAVYAGIRHRLPGRTEVGRMSALAAVGYGVFALLPALKVPANPPAVGDPNTVATRTTIYAGVLACGIGTAMVVSFVVSRLRGNGAGTAAVAVAGTVTAAALVALTLLLLPDSPDTIPADVPAAVVWNFRLASLGQLAVLWASLGLAGGSLLDRLSAPQARQAI